MGSLERLHRVPEVGDVEAHVHPTTVEVQAERVTNVLHTGTRRPIGALGADPSLYARDVGT